MRAGDVCEIIEARTCAIRVQCPHEYEFWFENFSAEYMRKEVVFRRANKKSSQPHRISSRAACVISAKRNGQMGRIIIAHYYAGPIDVCVIGENHEEKHRDVVFKKSA